MDGIDSDAAIRPARGFWGRLLRRPDGLVVRTRWLFTLFAVMSLLVATIIVLGAPGPTAAAAALVGYAGLVSVWLIRYRSGRAPVALGFAEAGLVLVTTSTSTDLPAVFSFLFASLWLRALYGSTSGILLHTTLISFALLGAVPLWSLWPGRGMPPASDVAALATSIPVTFLTVAVARNLALSLFARQESQHRDAALVRMGQRLIGVSDRDEIRAIATECVRAIGAATSGLRLLAVTMLDTDSATVVDVAGEMRQPPRTVPTSVLPPVGSGPGPLPDPGPLVASTGVGTWLGVPLGDGRESWVLMGARSCVPEEAVVSVRSMLNQVELAIVNSDAHNALATQASHDALTGLLNRAAFGAALDIAMADPDREVALMFLDLDDFKIVNDGMGHAAGDELLRVVARRLREGIRPGDLCARIGGDEFAVLLQDTDGSTAVGQRLVDLIAAPVSLMGQLAQVGVSVGLSYATPVDRSGEELVQRADVAMYTAKAKGKNRVQVFDQTLLQDDGRAQFETELAAAAAAGQLVVHYQPVVRVTDGLCLAAEALVRWRHPTRGLLHPVDFLPVAEATGAIVTIGAHVLRQACADAAAWSGLAGPLAVHVNVSVAQLTGPDIVDTVLACLADHGMEPARLVLEITESMVLDSPAVHATLFALADLGVAIAIDDFGTGYSALSTLRSLPVDIVKIDKSFLEGGPTRAADEAVVEAIVSMAARLGLRVVAEGVERVDQQQFLREVGAYAAQGYLYLRPTSSEHFVAWLEQQEMARRATTGVVTPIAGRRVETAG